MDLDVTIYDPGPFSKPFSLRIDKTPVPDTDLLESVCENDRSVTHMVGDTPARLTPKVLSSYVGVYEYGPGREARISSESDLLFLQEGANPLKLPLAAGSENELHIAYERRPHRLHQGRERGSHKIHLKCRAS
jgi:hypothetical protein